MFSFETTKTRIFQLMFIIGINDFFVKEHWDPDYIIFSEDKSSFIAKSVRNLLELHVSAVIQHWSLCYSDLPYAYLFWKKSVTKFMFRDIFCLHANSLFLAI